MTDSQLQITLFGEFSLVYAGSPVPAFSGDRPISLLAYLLLNRHTAVSRQHLAFTLWPDSSESQARTNLRNLFYTLRQTLPNADTHLAADSMTLQWRPDSDFTLDVAEFEEALTAAKTAGSDSDKIQCLETAVSFYKGDLLPGNYDDWIMPLREELRQQYLAALHQLVALLEQQQAYRTAARYSQRLLQQDPLDERAYVQLMRLHALSGDRAGLRRVYETCLATLRRELDVEPGPATQAAYEQLLRLEAPAAAILIPSPEKVPPPTSRLRPLPQPTTPFIGREAELAQVAELLADPNCRLLPIVGPGGMGKTRLALETASGHQAIFPDGVIWVPLTPVQTAGQVADAIAEALRYRLSGATPAEDELINLLAAKQMLLVLDNFEHLITATGFLTDLMAATTAIKLLVTSRQSLALQQEWRFELGELPLPDQEAPDTMSTNSAVLLFEQSARRAASTITLTAGDYPAIARICHLVGGIPLGIELAASWMRLLSCAEIAEEIEKSLDFLTASLRNVPPRHRSLRAVFDHSWQLLSPAEQQVLSRLTIFHGGFTREAAAQIAGAHLPLLSALNDRSLVQRTAVGRYSLHNLVRQYASDHLQADPAAQQATTQQHSHYYLQWLADQDAALRGPDQREALIAIALELANIRFAWQHVLNTLPLNLLQQASFTLFYFYGLRGLMQEGELNFRLAADKLRSAPDATSQEMQLAIHHMQTSQAYFALRLGQVTTAETLLQQAVTELQSFAEEPIFTYSLRYLGLTMGTKGRLDEAIQLFQQSLALANRYDRRWDTAIAQAYIGMTHHDKGLMSEAQPYLAAALANSRALGDPRLIAYSLLLSSRTNLEVGQLATASEQAEESLMVAGQTNDSYIINMVYQILGLLKQAQGDLTAARQLLEKSMESFALIDDLLSVERIFVSMGFLEIASGNLPAAKTLFLKILQVKQREQSPMHILGAIIGLATLRAHEGDPITALAWTLFVLHHSTIEWKMRLRAENLRAELESELTPDQIATAQAQAAQRTLAGIIAEATSQ